MVHKWTSLAIACHSSGSLPLSSIKLNTLTVAVIKDDFDILLTFPNQSYHEQVGSKHRNRPNADRTNADTDKCGHGQKRTRA
jgi:hypothetical protein